MRRDGLLHFSRYASRTGLGTTFIAAVYFVDTACQTRVDSRTVSEVVKVVLGLEKEGVILDIIIMCYSG